MTEEKLKLAQETLARMNALCRCTEDLITCEDSELSVGINQDGKGWRSLTTYLTPREREKLAKAVCTVICDAMVLARQEFEDL